MPVVMMFDNYFPTYRAETIAILRFYLDVVSTNMNASNRHTSDSWPFAWPTSGFNLKTAISSLVLNLPGWPIKSLRRYPPNLIRIMPAKGVLLGFAGAKFFFMSKLCFIKEITDAEKLEKYCS